MCWRFDCYPGTLDKLGKQAYRSFRKLNKKECEVLNLGWSKSMHHCWLGTDGVLGRIFATRDVGGDPGGQQMGQECPMGPCASEAAVPWAASATTQPANGHSFLAVVCWGTGLSLAPWYKNDMDILSEISQGH